MLLRVLFFIALFLPAAVPGVEVLPHKAVILYREPRYVSLKSFAAFELQRHLEMVTGVKMFCGAAADLLK